MLNWKICAAAASVALSLAAAVKGQDAAGPRLALIDDPAAEADDLLLPPSEYWLGVLAAQPSPAVQAELKLPKDQGLLVGNVQPKSPAEKAGLKERDVLLKANGKSLANVRDLLKLINEVKEGKLTLEVLRGGKHETVVATLAKRPANQMPVPLSPEAREWLKRFGATMKEGQPLRFQVFGPGQIVPQGAPGPAVPGVAAAKVEVTVRTKATLADGTRIEITRSGDDPAKVVVTQDKDRWECASDDLSKIPEKVRPEVERLLQAPTDHIHFFAMPGTITVAPNVEQRLAEMQKQIDELKEQVKALQGANAKKE